MEAKVCANKACASMGLPIPVTEFYTNKASSDGFASYCKVCHRARYKRVSGAGNEENLRVFRDMINYLRHWLYDPTTKEPLTDSQILELVTNYRTFQTTMLELDGFDRRTYYGQSR